MDSVRELCAAAKTLPNASGTADAVAIAKVVSLMNDIINLLPKGPQNITNEDIRRSLRILIECIPRSSEVLVTKFGTLLFRYTLNSKDFLDEKLVQELSEFLLCVIEGVRVWHDHTLDTLRALSAVLLDNGAKCPGQHARLVPLLINLGSASNGDSNSRRMAINCIGNLCQRTGAALNEHYPKLFNFLLNTLIEVTQEVEEQASLSRIISSTLRSLQIVVAEARNVHKDRLSEVVEKCSEFLAFGSPTGTAVQAARLNALVGEVREGGTEAGRRLSRTASEADLSETGSTTDRSQHDVSRKVRLNAVTCLEAVARASGVKMQSEWSKLLPDNERAQGVNVLSVILCDPCEKVRMAASHLLLTMLDGSRAFLANAHYNITASFTHSSQVAGGQVVQMHEFLFRAIATENDAAALAQHIRALAKLIESVTYNKRSVGRHNETQPPSRLLETAAASAWNVYVTRKEIPLRAASIGCISAICTSCSRPSMQEVEMLLSTPLSNKDVPSAATSTTRSLVLDDVLACAGDDTPTPATAASAADGAGRATSAQPEALVCMAAIARSYGRLLLMDPYWSVAKQLLAALISRGNPTVALLASRVVEELTGAANQKPEEDDGEEKKAEVAVLIPAEACLALWRDVFTTHVPAALSRAEPALRASGLTVLGNLPSAFADVISPEERGRVLTFATEGISATDVDLQPVACRVLGVAATLPAFRNDETHMRAIIAGLTFFHAQTAQPAIGTRVCWALGCVAESLGHVNGPAREEMLARVANMACDGAALTNEKVLCNAIRALGHSVAAMAVDASLFDRALRTILGHAQKGAAKIRWNACFSLGRALQNPGVLACLEAPAAGAPPSVQQILPTVCEILSAYPNPKTRKAAAKALNSGLGRAHYGGQYAVAVRAVVACLDIPAPARDTYADNQQRLALKAEAGVTLMHLLACAQDGDSSALTATLVPKMIFVVSAVEERLRGAQPNDPSLVAATQRVLAVLATCPDQASDVLLKRYVKEAQ